MSSSGKHADGRVCDVWQYLKEQLEEIAGGQCRIEKTRERPWASITFSGIRHRITIKSVSLCNNQWMQLKSRLAAHEFDLPGHFVADVLFLDNPESESNQILSLEILTIIDPVAPNLR